MAWSSYCLAGLVAGAVFENTTTAGMVDVTGPGVDIRPHARDPPRIMVISYSAAL